MLALLKIRNLALVDELAWEPCSGFLGITGETGAGKSVVMGGIALALGERADKTLIRSGETQCSIEAAFHLPRAAEVNAQLEEAGVPPCEDGELLIRRTITPTGNRQFINNTPVTLALLKGIGSGLVDMHQPDSHRSLTSQERQMVLLDAFAEDAELLARYRAAYRAMLDARAAYRELQESEMANAREIDFLQHQVEEIESANLTAEEVEGLEARWQRARNAGRLRDTAVPMAQALDGDEDAVLPRLHRLIRSAHDLERLDAAAAKWLEPLNSALEELDDVARSLRDYADGLDADPAEAAALEERVATLDTLKRKYGADFAAIQEHLQACREKLDSIANREERLAELEAAQQAAEAAVAEAGKALSAARRKAAPRLEKDFLTHAAQLGFKQSFFTVQLTETEPGPQGMDEIEVLFGPNPGEPVKPLRLIASSGELARVMLALKSALAKQDDTPLLIFDEIDANVGGEIARAVGMKMRELGRDHQVIAITHFPQVAALADHHYLISKATEGGRTTSRLQEVRDDARVAELVRMLGSHGKEAEAHARTLLQA
ncbi:MAG: DNA repair protein RecN [Akkermansia sp.]|nr:DNA repair protein RecN [Akkermansia sp.]